MYVLPSVYTPLLQLRLKVQDYNYHFEEDIDKQILKKIKIKFEKKIFKNKMLSFGVSCGCNVSSVHKPFFFCNASLLDSLYETPTNSFYCLCLLNHK